MELLGDFIKNLKSSLDIFCIFVDLVSKNDFPLNNIAWQLFLDVVRFYNADNVTGLRFDDENSSNMLFWIYGQWLMHGKFTRFMAGEKFAGALTLGQRIKGRLNPKGIDIDFAVPSDKTLREKSKSLVTLPRNVQPGLLHPTLDMFKWTYWT